MWWEYVVAAVVVAIALYGFALLVGVETRVLTRKTDRRAEQMYANYAGSKRRSRHDREQHRSAGQ